MIFGPDLWYVLAGHCSCHDHLKGKSKAPETYVNVKDFFSGHGFDFYIIKWCKYELQVVSLGRKKFSADFQLMFRILKLFLFIGTVITIVVLFVVLKLTIGDIFASLLAFLPTGWALLQVYYLFEFKKEKKKKSFSVLQYKVYLC